MLALFAEKDELLYELDHFLTEEMTEVFFFRQRLCKDIRLEDADLVLVVGNDSSRQLALRRNLVIVDLEILLLSLRQLRGVLLHKSGNTLLLLDRH